MKIEKEIMMTIVDVYEEEGWIKESLSEYDEIKVILLMSKIGAAMEKLAGKIIEADRKQTIDWLRTYYSNDMLLNNIFSLQMPEIE